MNTTESEHLTHLLSGCYAYGMTDAATDSAPDRYSAKPQPGAKIAPGECACTEFEAQNWAEMRKHYLLGYEGMRARLVRPAKVSNSGAPDRMAT